MTDYYARAREVRDDPNTPQNLREILEAELGSESVTVEELIKRLNNCDDRIYQMCIHGRGPHMSVPVRQDDDDIFICRTIELAKDKLARLDQLWTEALGCAARSMERVRELEEGK